MSKSTNRYGNVIMQARVTIDANPQPSQRAVQQLKEVETLAQKHFGKRYDRLTDRQKSELHFNLNTGKYDAKSVSQADGTGEIDG